MTESSDLWRCEHETTAIRRRTRSNGVVVHCIQCLRCGASVREISKNSPESMRQPVIDPFDEGLRDRWYEQRQAAWRERQAEWQRQLEETKAERDAEWRARYMAHLESAEWAALRKRVLERADGICEGCGRYSATQVHHLTYEHLGAEFLWELRAICRRCHTRLHGIVEPTIVVRKHS